MSDFEQAIRAGFSTGLFRAIRETKERVQRERAARGSCPICGAVDMICSVTHRGITLGKFCVARGCNWNTFGVGVPTKRARRRR